MTESQGEERIRQHGDGHVSERSQSHQSDGTGVSLVTVMSSVIKLLQICHLGHPGQHSPRLLLTHPPQVGLVIEGDIIEAVLSVIPVGVVVRDDQRLRGAGVDGDLPAAGSI